MTTKEASIKFRLSVEEIRRICKSELIPNTYKNNGKWDISDDTEIILTKTAIRHILLDIVKYKNNCFNVISGKYTNNPEMLNKIISVLSNLHFVGEYKHNPNVEEIFRSTQLTDYGFAMLFSGNKNTTNNIYFQLLHADIQIGLINIK